MEVNSGVRAAHASFISSYMTGEKNVKATMVRRLPAILHWRVYKRVQMKSCDIKLQEQSGITTSTVGLPSVS